MTGLLYLFKVSLANILNSMQCVIGPFRGHEKHKHSFKNSSHIE